MKYRDSFLNFYILNPLHECIKNLCHKLNTFRVDMFDLWYCQECKKYHTKRVVNYNKDIFSMGWCIKGKGKEKIYEINNVFKFLDPRCSIGSVENKIKEEVNTNE